MTNVTLRGGLEKPFRVGDEDFAAECGPVKAVIKEVEEGFSVSFDFRDDQLVLDNCDLKPFTFGRDRDLRGRVVRKRLSLGDGMDQFFSSFGLPWF